MAVRIMELQENIIDETEKKKFTDLKIMKLEIMNYETVIYPFPLYEIVFPEGYTFNELFFSQLKSVSKFTADIYLCSLNSLVKKFHPASRGSLFTVRWGFILFFRS